MIKTKVDFSKSSDWLEKSRPSKKATFVWSCKQANYKSNIVGFYAAFRAFITSDFDTF